MDHTTSSPLLLQRLAQWAAAQRKSCRVPFLASLVFGFLAYGFTFTNKLVNHDEVFSLFIKGATVDSGRWGLGALDSIFPNISMPWIYGIFTIVFLALAVCLMTRIFRVENRLLQVLFAGCVLVFPSLTGTFGYMFTSCSFALSFLSATVAVWLMQEKGIWRFLFALGFLVFSLSIYQSYIALAAGLLVLMLIHRLLHGEDTVSLIRSGVLYVVFLILSLGLYYGATQVILKLLHVEMNGYASGNLGFSLAAIPANILESYRSFFRYFTEGFRGLFPTALSRGLHMTFLVISLVLLVLWALARKEKKAGRLLLLAALVGILPLALNCMYLFTVPDSIHTLVLYGMVGIYAFAVIVSDACLSLMHPRPLGTVLLNMLTVCLSAILLLNIYIANAASLNLYLRYENAYSFYTALAADIRQMPEFDENTTIAVIGTWQEPSFYEEKFPFLTELTGVKGFLPDSYSRAKFLEFYIGLPIPSASEEEMAAITATAEFAQMPAYPYYGSTKFFGDTLVVKLS